MTTFNGDPKLKQACLERASMEQLRLSTGEPRNILFWSRHQWCDPAQRCQIPDCKHDFYAKEIDIQTELAYTERALFELLPQYRANSWPGNFLNTVPVGVDLDGVWKDFVLHVLNDNQHGMLNFARDRVENDAIVRVLELFEQGSLEDLSWLSAIEACEKIERPHVYSSDNIQNAEALAMSGYYAVQTAADFARSFKQPRFAAAAVRNAVQPTYWKSYAVRIAAEKRPQPGTGHDSFRERSEAENQWKKQIEGVTTVAANERDRETVRLADQFLAFIYAKTPPGAISKFFSQLFS